MVCWGLSFGLSGLVWSGLAGLVWLYSCLDEELLLVLFCLFARSFRAVCCIQYSFCLVFVLLILNLTLKTLSYLLAVLIDNS